MKRDQPRDKYSVGQGEKYEKLVKTRRKNGFVIHEAVLI